MPVRSLLGDHAPLPPGSRSKDRTPSQPKDGPRGPVLYEPHCRVPCACLCISAAPLLARSILGRHGHTPSPPPFRRTNGPARIRAGRDWPSPQPRLTPPAAIRSGGAARAPRERAAARPRSSPGAHRHASAQQQQSHSASPAPDSTEEDGPLTLRPCTHRRGPIALRPQPRPPPCGGGALERPSASATA